MPYKCYVKSCRTNKKHGDTFRLFAFPQHKSLREDWAKAINREDIKPNIHSRVCIKHFKPEDIVTETSAFDSKNKTTITVPLKNFRLKPDAVPCIFEDNLETLQRVSNIKLLTACKAKKKVKSSVGNRKNAKNLLPAGSDSHVRKTSKGDSNQNSPKKSSPTTDRPIIAVIKAQDLTADDTRTQESMDEEDCVIEQPSSSSTSFSLPSPFKNLPNVSVCLKEEDRVPFIRELKGIKRSPSTGSNSSTGSSEQLKPGAITKRRKIEKPAPVVLGRDNDCYCWICHRENIVLCCIACPRAYHPKCAGETSIVSPDWVCPECQRILAAENVDTRSSTLAEISLDKLGALLKLSLNKMKQRAPPAFHQPVSLEQYPLYLHYVIHPMDLSLLEKNIKNKVYGCTEAFLADVKWIAHNSCVFNGTQYPLSNSAKSLVKACELDMQEIEVCPDCFVHSIVRNKYWFSEVCRKPHPLVWAKLKGFPYWPAKVVRIVDGNVDARFFGAHDRAWVPVSQCYHLSKEMPTTSKPKKKGNYEAALDELNVHVHILIQKFGCFEYATYRTSFNPENKCLMYHGIDIEKASKEDISFDTTASPSSIRFHSPEKENRFASYMESETEKANADEERLQGGLPDDCTKVLHATKENPLSFLFKDRLDDPSSTPREKGLVQKTSERSSVEEKKINTVEETKSPSKVPSLKKSEAISDSDQLRKLELVLERIKGYVSPNVDTEKDSVDEKDEKNEKQGEESASKTENNEEIEKTKLTFSKSSSILDTFLLPIIEKNKATENISESTENINVLSAATEKKDSLKLNNIIESCKAMLGISNITDDVDNESVVDENASRSGDEEDDTSTSEADEENSSLSEEEAGDETRNVAASDEEAENGAENEVKGNESSEAEVTDDSDYEGEVEEESSSESSDTDVEDDSIKGELSEKSKETSQNKDNVQDVGLVDHSPSINPNAELFKHGVNNSSKLGGNEESSSMDVIENILESDNDCDQDINSKTVSLEKEMRTTSVTVNNPKAGISNQDIDNGSLPVSLNVSHPVNLGDLASPKQDTSTLQKNSIKFESENGNNVAQHTLNRLSKNASDKLQSSNNEEEDDEIIICDSPPRPKTPPVIVLDDDQENGDSSVSDTFAIKTSPPHSTSAESLVNDEINDTCQNNYDDVCDNSSSPKGVLVNSNVSKKSSVEDSIFKNKGSEDAVRDKKRNLSCDDSSEDDIQIVTAVKKSKLTGAIRTFNKSSDGSPIISALPRQEFQEENIGKENCSPMKIASPSPDKEQLSDREEDSITPPVTPLKSPVIDTSHLSDKDKEIFFLKHKLNGVLKAYHLQNWKCRQEREELRHNMNLIIMEMRACLEADKKQAIELLTRNYEQEKLKCIDETKKKQWCASCRMESRYACCWNTSYCSVNCQKRHFPDHKVFCTQVKNRYTSVASDAIEDKQKIAPKGKQKISSNLTDNSEKGNKLIILNMKTSEPAKNVPDLSLVSSQQIISSKPQIQVVTAKSQLQVSSSPSTSSPLQFIIGPMKSSTSTSLATETIKSSSSLSSTAVHMPTTTKLPALSTVPSSVSIPIQPSTPILVPSSVMSLSALPPTSIPSTITSEEQPIAKPLILVPVHMLPNVTAEIPFQFKRSNNAFFRQQVGQTTIVNPTTNSPATRTIVKMPVVPLSERTQNKKSDKEHIEHLSKTTKVKSSCDYVQPTVQLSFSVSSDDREEAQESKEPAVEHKNELNEKTTVSPLDDANQPMIELICVSSNESTDMNEHMQQTSETTKVNSLEESEDEDWFDTGGSPLNAVLEELEEETESDQIIGQPLLQLPFSVSSNPSAETQKSDKDLEVVPMQQLNEKTTVELIDESSQESILEVESRSTAVKVHNAETLSSNIVSSNTAVLPLVSQNWTKDFVVPWDKMPVKFLCTLSMGKKPSLLEVANMIKIVSDAVQEVDQNPGKEDLSVICKYIVQRYPESFPNGKFGNSNVSLVHLMEKSFEAIKKEKMMNSIKENKICKESDIFNKLTVTGTSDTNKLETFGVSPINSGETKTSNEETEAEQVQHLSERTDVICLGESDVAGPQNEGSSGILSANEINSSQNAELMPKMKPNWAENFTIPWEKMPTSLLKAILLKQRPSPNIRRIMIRIISSSIQEITPRPGLKALSVICKNIVQSYPESFNETYGREVVGEDYSLLLKKMAMTISCLNHRLIFSRKYQSEKLSEETCVLKKNPLRNGCNSLKVLSSTISLSKSEISESETRQKAEVVEQPSTRPEVNPFSPQNIAECKSTSEISKIQEIISSRKISSDWIQNFIVPWDEMPEQLLQALSVKQRPSSIDRQEMIRVISNSIQKVIPKPGRKALSVICRNIVQKYPESFSDIFHGKVVTGCYTSLLNEIDNMFIYPKKRIIFNKKWRRKPCIKACVSKVTPVRDDVNSENVLISGLPLNKSEESFNFNAKFKAEHVQQLSKRSNTNYFNESDSADICQDKGYSGVFKDQECSVTRNTELVCEDWAVNFVIPWDYMPKRLLRTLAKNQRPNPSDRYNMIRIIINSIQKVIKKPNKRELSVICKNIIQKYPESFCDALHGEVVGEGYTALLNQMVTRVANINRKIAFNKSKQKKKSPTNNEQTNVHNTSCAPMQSPSVPPNQNEETQDKTEFEKQCVNQVYELDSSNECGEIFEHDDESCSELAKDRLKSLENTNWAENFTIPWNKVPEKLFHRLLEKEVLSRSEKLSVIRIISDFIQKITIKPGKEALSIICKNIVQKYPESFCDTLFGETTEEAVSSVLKQMERRFDNLDTEMIYFDDVHDVIPLDDSEDEDWSNAIDSSGNGSSSESEEEEERKCQTTNTGQATGIVKTISSQNTELSLSWAEDFSIPWNELPDYILSVLSTKGRPSMAERRLMLRIISNSIAKINPKPGVKALSVICRNIVKTYPESFKDVLHGEVIGEGYSSVLKQMERRFDNKNRCKKSDKLNCDYEEVDILSDDNKTFTKDPEVEHMEQLNKSPETSLLNEPDRASALQADECNPFPYVDPHWEEKFIIPWTRMPNNLLYALAEKRRPCPNDREHMINVIFDSIRKITLKPGKKALSVICRNIVQKYPESFSDAWCGVVTHDSFSSLLKQMTDKFCNINKGLDPFSMIAESRKSIKGSNVSRGIRLSEYYGCINWQPSCFPKNENEETQRLKKEEMQSLFQQGLESLDLNYYTKLLVDTYFSVRKDINNGHSIDFLRKEWPLLFIKDGLLHHFEMLVGINVLDKLSAAYLSKGPVISSFIITKPLGCDKKMIIDVLAEIDMEKDIIVQDKVPNFAVVISLLMSYFGEAKEVLFLSVNVNSTVDQIENILKNKPTNMNTACLICCGNTMWSSKSYMLSIDSTVVNDDIKCFEDGLAMLFASFFVFNLEYPKFGGATLEFIQRCFLDINPSKGTKVGRAKSSGPNPKVMKLINNINDFRLHV